MPVPRDARKVTTITAKGAYMECEPKRMHQASCESVTAMVLMMKVPHHTHDNKNARTARTRELIIQASSYGLLKIGMEISRYV